MNICYVICALDFKLDFVPDKNDFVIGADKGYLTLMKNDIDPDLIIGDFDSSKKPDKLDNVIIYPVKKDFTDSALAIDYAINKGYSKILVYGAIGGFLDHTLANIAVLASATKKGIDIGFVDNENIIFAVNNGKITFDSNATGRISVFSFGDRAEAVYEKGLLYELDNATLFADMPLGVSNEFIGRESSVSVGNGMLLIYTSKENYDRHLTRL